MNYSELVTEMTAVYQEACTGHCVYFNSAMYAIYHDLAVIRWAARGR